MVKPDKTKPSFNSVPVKNGATIEAKNINPTLDRVSARSLSCGSDSCIASDFYYIISKKAVNFVYEKEKKKRKNSPR